ncbi:aldo/keto reductase [Frankia sp. Cas3]|uniref:aldo/keto reductase n=1 Tax=Frankia sp. Cas3 TaxID=3073926 RepID=UPI002AD4344A|nr:aldo/keto reductase [Frankia sp. Cas3]
MNTTTLGDDGPSVGRIGLGCMGMSWAYDEPGRDDAESVRVIHRALDLGVTLIDTADAYGPFTNEYLVGRALAGHRDRAVLATKAGLVVDGTRTMHRNGRPEHIAACIDASLLRLRTDHIDLYQLHRVDPAVPLEESWGAMAEAVQAGKARALGLSEVTVAEIARAQAIHPVASVQSEASLWSRDIQDNGVLAHTAAHGIALLPFSPLGRGFLTGAIRTTADLPPGDWRHGNPRFQPAEIHTNQRLVDTVRTIAARLDATPAQVALAWLLALGPHVVPIPGTKNPARLNENAAAADLSLPDDARKELDSLPAPATARY